jgi:hypothetical protein
MDPRDATDDTAVPSEDAADESVPPDPAPDVDDGGSRPSLRPSWEPL